MSGRDGRGASRRFWIESRVSSDASCGPPSAARSRSSGRIKYGVPGIPPAPPEPGPDAWRTLNYLYDAAGRRIAKQYDAVTVLTYVYDGDHCIAEYDAYGNVKRKYIYGPCTDEPISMTEATGSYAGTYYHHFDALGSVVALTNSSGNTVEVYEYDVFGRVGASDATHPNRLMFTGREYDKETGLYYYRARYYNPQIGRFLQTDPVGYGPGMNVYAYCRNNPVGSVDPSGCEDVSLGEMPDSPYYEPTGEIMVCDYRFDAASIDAMNQYIKADGTAEKICKIKDMADAVKVALEIAQGKLPQAQALKVPATAFAGVAGGIMDRLINNIIDSCNVQLYKAYIKVQGYKRSNSLIRLGLGLIWPEVAWEKGPAKWVEVQGGNGWENWLGNTGYTEATDAYNAAAAALADSSRFRYRPKKQ